MQKNGETAGANHPASHVFDLFINMNSCKLSSFTLLSNATDSICTLFVQTSFI